MSSYAIKLTGDLKALENSITIYREALHFVIPIVDTHWDEMKDFEYANQRMAYTEKLVHTTKDNEARYPFDVEFPKFPSYLRRAALNRAIGIVSSYRSNLANWEFLDFKGKQVVKRAHFWRYKRIFSVLGMKAHRHGLRIARVNARNTSRLAFDGSGTVKRGWKISKETPYSIIQFTSGKFYNADLNASYNIGARYWIRHHLKPVPETERLALEAKVPQVAKRSTCTLSHLISLRSELIASNAKRTQA